jgi:hypothetical protein
MEKAPVYGISKKNNSNTAGRQRENLAALFFVLVFVR